MHATVLILNSVEELDEQLPGPLVPTNPVKWAAYQAMSHADGRPVEIVVGHVEPPYLRTAESPLSELVWIDKEPTYVKKD